MSVREWDLKSDRGNGPAEVRRKPLSARWDNISEEGVNLYARATIGVGRGYGFDGHRGRDLTRPATTKCIRATTQRGEQ